MATYIHNLQDKASLETCFPDWRTLSMVDLKQAYKKKALEYHPDKNPNGEAMFKQVSKWYNILIDPKERRVLEADLSAFNRADIHRSSTFNTAPFTADTGQNHQTQSRRTEQHAPFTDDKKWHQEYNDFKTKEFNSTSRASGTTRSSLSELIIQQRIEQNYVEIKDIIYKIKQQLNEKREKISPLEATNLLNQIEQGRVKIINMLSNTYPYKNYLKDNIKIELQNMLKTQITELKTAVNNNRTSQPKAAPTTEAPKVRRMHHPSSGSSFQNMTAKPGDKSDVAYTTHFENLANDLLSTPKNQDNTNKRRKLDAHRPGKLGEIERELYATDLAYKQDLLRAQQEEDQKVKLEDLGSRHPTSSHQPSNKTNSNVNDLLEDLLKVYTKPLTEQQHNPERVTRLTEQVIEELRKMKNNNPAAQASWRRKR